MWLYLEIRSVFSSVQFSCSVVSNSLQPHESQHARPPCPSPTPGIHSESCPSSRWCHPAISSSAVPFSSCTNPSQHQGLFQWINSSHEVAKVLEFQLQHHSLQRYPTGITSLWSGTSSFPPVSVMPFRYISPCMVEISWLSLSFYVHFSGPNFPSPSSMLF